MPDGKPTGLILIALLAATLMAGSAMAASEAVPGAGDVHVLRLPADYLVPDVMLDQEGVLHLVHALDGNAHYVRSSDNGSTFSPPVQVNSSREVEFRMGERGPRLALGRSGLIHVLWMDRGGPGIETYARYTRSLDGGKSFEPDRALSSMTGIDGATLTADEAGHVLAFWHAASPPQSEVPTATWLHVTRSDDDGTTFTHDEHVKVSGQSALACACCMMRARVGPDGNVYLAYRGASHIRDMYVLKGSPAGNDFTSVRVNEDNWEINTCPVVGPELTYTSDGRQLCAFMSERRVYWAISDRGVTRYDLHVPTPAGEQSEMYPTAVANRAGQVLFVWQVGPLSTTGQATVKWAKYDLTGQFLGEQGTLGVSTSGTKPTAFVGTDDHFYIVTSAR